MLQVYLDPCTVNSRKVLAGLELVGMPYELKHVDYFTGAHKKPEFLGSTRTGRCRLRWMAISRFRNPMPSCNTRPI